MDAETPAVRARAGAILAAFTAPTCAGTYASIQISKVREEFMRSSLALAAVSLCAAVLARASLHGTDTPPPSRVHASDTMRVCAAPKATPSTKTPDLTRVRASRALDDDCSEWVRVPTLSASINSVLQPNAVVQSLLSASIVGDR